MQIKDLKNEVKKMNQLDRIEFRQKLIRLDNLRSFSMICFGIGVTALFFAVFLKVLLEVVLFIPFTTATAPIQLGLGVFALVGLAVIVTFGGFFSLGLYISEKNEIINDYFEVNLKKQENGSGKGKK